MRWMGELTLAVDVRIVYDRSIFKSKNSIMKDSLPRIINPQRMSLSSGCGPRIEYSRGVWLGFVP